ncbi:MAG TPA: glycosyltransferase family 39 protein [Flavobacteriales bacterium]|nr:glycosyltransferase family 39 protein [Flavobacteriales bacterium]
MSSRGRIQLLIAVVAAVFFVPGLGAVHLFDWDEINFAEIAREMVVSGDWSRPQVGFVPFHEKPPLFMWLQATSMTLFGVGEFAARLPDAICGIITLITLFRIGERVRNRTFGLLWVLAYFGSILPHLYFRSGIIDPWFNLFIFLGIDRMIRASQRDDRASVHAALAGLFIGLAILTKGPVGVLIPALVFFIFWGSMRFRNVISWRSTIIIALATVITAGSWLAYDFALHGPDFLVDFFKRQLALLTTEDADHGGFFGYHFVVLLIGCFPASAFALQEMLKPSRTEGPANEHRRWMLILFWVVLILFTLVETKIVHYSSLCNFPLTYLAALQLERIWSKQEAFGWSRYMLGIIGNVFAVAAIALPFVAMHADTLKPFFNDDFAKDNLDAAVGWSGVEVSAGLLLLIALVIGHVLHGRGRFRRSLLVTFIGSALFVTVSLYFLINNIEAYSQRAAVEFFRSKASENCWLMAKGYKSYVPDFYGELHAAQPDAEVLINGTIDRSVYIACKADDREARAALGKFTELYEKNGFVFYERKP